MVPARGSRVEGFGILPAGAAHFAKAAGACQVSDPVLLLPNFLFHASAK
jgi:hypothetical protein